MSGAGPNLSENDSSSNASSSSQSTSTSIADSYNETRYTTENIADSGNVSLTDGSMLHSGAGDFYSGASNIGNSSIGNVSYGGAGVGNSSGGAGGFDIAKYLPYILGAVGIFLIVKLFFKH